MDQDKCDALKADLDQQPWPPLARIERFLDGNDDPGSIGCNLRDHPGLDAFRRVLLGLLARADVESIHAQVDEIDPNADCWPFADTLLIVGTIPAADLTKALAPLQPDEVGPAATDLPDALRGKRVLVAWWD